MSNPLEFTASSLSGRYLPPEAIDLWVSQSRSKFWRVIGQSNEGRSIYVFEWGRGSTRVFMWSQMHGNESTTTRALSDMIDYLISSGTEHPWYKEFSFCLIPQLNPDGAKRFTRTNANNVDLNRDARNLNEIESQLLRSTFEEFKPNYCFNLHDQRSIFGAGISGEPAQLSFLAPAADAKKSKTSARIKAAFLIVEMYKALKVKVGNRIGRYDDQYNGHCVGDTFQGHGIPTVLIEAGHANNDYQREECRALIRLALEIAVRTLKDTSMTKVTNWPEHYDAIPENTKNFCDIHIQSKEDLIGFQYREQLLEGELHFIPFMLSPAELPPYAHLYLSRDNPADTFAIQSILKGVKRP